MPNLFLEVVKGADGKTTDPADDVAEFLMNSQQGWKPEMTLPRQLSPAEEKALDDLALLYLSDKFPVETAKNYLYDGIPASQGYAVIGDEAVIVNPEPPPAASGKHTANTTSAAETAEGERAANEKVVGEGAPGVQAAAEKAATEQRGSAGAEQESPEHKRKRLARTMEYVGRRTIGKFGCFGCHDIPGYEDAKTIGTGLADWGRKDPSRLAFEEVIEYVTHHPNGLHPNGIPAAAKPVANTVGVVLRSRRP